MRYSILAGTVSNLAADRDRPRFPRATYRSGGLVHYDLEAGGSGLSSIDEEDTPAATFGGRANQARETRRYRRDPPRRRAGRRAESPEIDNERFLRAPRLYRGHRNAAGNQRNLGPGRGAQQPRKEDECR